MVISSVTIDSASEITLTADSDPRGGVQGTATPTFTFEVDNNVVDPCQVIIMLGEEKCPITEYTATSITCSFDEPLDSEESYLIKFKIINFGEAVIGQTNKGSYYAVPVVDSIGPVSGSLAGGGTLTVTGSGFESEDDIAEVTFVIGGVEKECKISSKTNTEIVCEIPNSGQTSSDWDGTVYVTISAKNLPTARSDGSTEAGFTFTYSESLTPIATAVTGENMEAGGGTIGIEITLDPGATVTFLLVPIDTDGSRRKKRSIRSTYMAHDENTLNQAKHMPLRKRSMGQFFEANVRKLASHLDGIHWKVGGSGANGLSSIPSFMKADVPDKPCHSGHVLLFEDNETPEDLGLDSNDIEHVNFVHRHKRSTLKKAIEKHRRSFVKHREIREVQTQSNDGTIQGTVTSQTETGVSANFGNVPVGNYQVVVKVDGKGSALGQNLPNIVSSGSLTSIDPATGSTMGGTEVTISGGVFHTGDNAVNTVTIGGVDCEVRSATSSQIVCITGSNSGTEALAAAVAVTSNGESFPAGLTFDYATASTPTVDSNAPTSGSASDSVTLTGTMFGTDMAAISVSLGSMDTTVTSNTDTTIDLEVPNLPGGVTYDFMVKIDNLGYASIAAGVEFTVNLAINSISPTEGSKGGGTLLTIDGSGFDTTDGVVSVKVCDMVCPIEGTPTASQVQCLTPADETTDATTMCDVTVAQGDDGSVTVTAGTQFTYDSNLTPAITNVSPNEGGTGGGTPIVITGTGFAASGNKVTIGGSECIASAESTTEISCETEPRAGSGKFPVLVEVPGQGYATLPDDGSGIFNYVDRWSSIWTWGGTTLPIAGDFVVLESGQEIVLDVDTPVFKFLLINGGHLRFDTERALTHLQSEFILILNDGILEVSHTLEEVRGELILIIIFTGWH